MAAVAAAVACQWHLKRPAGLPWGDTRVVGMWTEWLDMLLGRDQDLGG